MRTALLALGMILLAGFAGQHQPPAAEKIEVPTAGADVPMADFEGRPMVDATVDGNGPYRFLVDTGASATVIESWR